jgi:hypothetical protein
MRTINLSIVTLYPERYFLRDRQQQQEPETPNIHMPTGFFEFPVVLAAQVLLLPCVQDQAGEIASGVNRGARVGAGRANRVEIEMLEISVSVHEDRQVRGGLHER